MNGDVVVGHHRRAAQIDLHDPPGHAVHLHAVAEGDGPLGQQDDAADKIVDDVLQAEADAHTDCARHQRQGAEVNAHHLQRDIKPHRDEEVARDAADGVLQRF